MSAHSYPPTWDKTITIYSKVKASDNTDKTDKWYRTVVRGCFWKSVQNRAVTEQGVTFSASYVCRVPLTPLYKPYDAFKLSPVGFSLSLGDIIILGEVTDSMTAQNRLDIISSHKPDTLTIGSFTDNARVNFLQHYLIEGV